MKKKVTRKLIDNILILICGIAMIVICEALWKDYEAFKTIIGIVRGSGIIVGCFIFILGICKLKDTYKFFLIENRKSKRLYKQLTNEELEIVEDAKNLIKKVDGNIIITDFNVYKVNFIMDSWFYYDEDTKELNIFIPFKLFIKFGKNFCFMAVVHEILHLQNLKNNIPIFNDNFLEGLNQLLTEWLIKNYSEKYEIPKDIIILSLCINKKSHLDIPTSCSVYEKEVNMVENILQSSEIDLKEIFCKYIDIQPEFFKSFIPEKYFKKQ